MTPADSNLTLRPADLTDAAAIAEIYNYYVIHSTVTFEDVAVDPDQMAERIHDIRAKNLPWILAASEKTVFGYAYAAPWRTRSAYQRTVEVTVYIFRECTGQGIGNRLYAALLDQLRNNEFHTAIGVIALPNPQSIRLHERFGFEQAAHLKQVGFKMGRWVDVGYWQLFF